MTDTPPTLDELREAHNEALTAYVAATTQGAAVLIDYVVVTVEYQPTDDGGDAAILGWFGAPSQPAYRAAGLIEWARRAIAEKYDPTE